MGRCAPELAPLAAELGAQWVSDPKTLAAIKVGDQVEATVIVGEDLSVATSPRR